jgi:hypothetical protein
MRREERHRQPRKRRLTLLKPFMTGSTSKHEVLVKPPGKKLSAVAPLLLLANAGGNQQG